MELNTATRVFSALGNITRLRAFRALIEAGPTGLTAGAIARSLDVPPSTLTAHLGRLVQADLLQSWRSERNIYYAIRVEQVRDVVAYLTMECCRGQPELCGFEGKASAAGQELEDSA
ncbi:MAG: helix-turn-helix domain-containing protein [Alphaproteobacteria bacterium]|nr:helix-turn-helix domain-containing protein [Alphaproteobacteria bacterium]